MRSGEVIFDDKPRHGKVTLLMAVAGLVSASWQSQLVICHAGLLGSGMILPTGWFFMGVISQSFVVRRSDSTVRVIADTYDLFPEYLFNTTQGHSRLHDSSSMSTMTLHPQRRYSVLA